MVGTLQATNARMAMVVEDSIEAVQGVGKAAILVRGRGNRLAQCWVTRLWVTTGQSSACFILKHTVTVLN